MHMVINNEIQMVDLKGQYLKNKDQFDTAINNCIQAGAFINGPEVKLFQNALEEYLQVKRVIPCANGTDALQIAMMALDLKPGDEVLVPAFTYVATAEVIALLGLVPVWVDVDPLTFNIDPQKIEAVITKKTKAIVPVHLYGQCADMESILKIAAAHNLYVIEDTAQAIGADYLFQNGNKAKAGTMGNIGCTSFFPSKNLGCYGDGGALYSNDESLGKKIHMIANHGQSVKYQHDVVGVNSRLDSIQAAILSVKLNLLNSYSEARNAAAVRYDSLLKDVPQIAVPYRSVNSNHVFHQYTLIIREGNRDSLKKHLESAGIPSMVYYPIPMHLQKAYTSDKYPNGSFPIAEGLSQSVLSLPMHTELNEDTQVYIVEKIKEFYTR